MVGNGVADGRKNVVAEHAYKRDGRSEQERVEYEGLYGDETEKEDGEGKSERRGGVPEEGMGRPGRQRQSRSASRRGGGGVGGGGRYTNALTPGHRQFGTTRGGCRVAGKNYVTDKVNGAKRP